MTNSTTETIKEFGKINKPFVPTTKFTYVLTVASSVSSAKPMNSEDQGTEHHEWSEEKNNNDNLEDKWKDQNSYTSLLQ